METLFLNKADGSRLAWCQLLPKDVSGEGVPAPEIMFLPGLMSDMRGTKAVALYEYCQSKGYGFLILDYRGHGESDGDFTDGGIGEWLVDTLAVLDHATTKPQIMIGSSMGGWLMSLVARSRPDLVAGLIGIAAAPDFTEDQIWPELSEAQRQEIMEKGVTYVKSGYEEPYAFTRHLIEDGRQNLVLREPLTVTCPVHLLHGIADPTTPYQASLRLAEHIASQDVTVELIKDGDHSLSRPQDLERLFQAVEGIARRL